MLFASRSGSMGRSSLPCDQLRLIEARQLDEQRDAVAGEALAHDLACTPQRAHRLASEDIPGLRLTDRRETVRLVEIGGDPDQESVAAETARDGDGELVLNPPRCRGASVPDRSMNASPMESGSTGGVMSSIASTTRQQRHVSSCRT